MCELSLKKVKCVFCTFTSQEFNYKVILEVYVKEACEKKG